MRSTMPICCGTPGMGVNLWGASPLCEDESLKEGRIPTVTPIDKALGEGNCGFVRGEEAGAKLARLRTETVYQGRSAQASVPSNTKPFSSRREGKRGACARKVHVLIRGRLPDVPVSSACHERQGGMGRPMSCGQLTADVVVLDPIRH